MSSLPATDDRTFADWSTAFQNDLPDSSFAHIDAGGTKDSEGKTTPRSKRHLPYKDANGKVDLPHVRNALARLNQTQGVGMDKAAIRKKLENALKRAAAEPTSDDVHVDGPDWGKKRKPGFDSMRTFLAKLSELLRPKVAADDFREAVVQARSHTGGKARAANRQAYDPSVEWSPSGPYGRMDDDDDDDDDDVPRLPKADSRVNFRGATKVGEQCSNCAFWDADADDPYPECRVVEGYIPALGYCDLFMARPGAPTGGTEPMAALEPHAAIEPPAQIPYLPAPGTYTHPQYGDLAITPERIARFIDQFNRGVYQSRIPIDAEHQTKMSGAMGWITRLLPNREGGADAAVEWTDRGAALLRADRYAFFSPEWFESWTDPATGTQYQDVACGGALTTRPFFKDGALRPLAASEAGSVMLNLAPRGAQEGPMAEPTLGAAEAKAFAEMQTKLAALEAERDATRQMAEQAQTALTQATERVTALETDARRKRFAEVVEGRGGAGDGQRWYGDIAKHVGLMERLAGAFGEDSDELKQYIEQNQAHATQLHTAGLFDEKGQTGMGAMLDATAQIKAKVAERRAAEPTLSEPDAWVAVMAAEPSLYTEYRAEQERQGR